MTIGNCKRIKAGLAVGAYLSQTVTAMTALQTCFGIQSNVSSSSSVIVDSLDPTFIADTHHWFDSSSQTPTCVFEPGSPEDISVAIDLIAQTQTPFALQCGGHISNPGFSSTAGIHISLKQFDQVILSEDSSTVEIGMGLTWTEVYKQLDSTGVNVVGGRVSGPGVAGVTLGGGFSWKTNQHGLACDTVQAYNVVLPNGTITSASDETNTDLFFALKGGLNRFAIVTSIVYKTHTQPPKIYGGLRLYSYEQVDAVLNATEVFSRTSTDPKAQIILTIEALPGSVGVTPVVLFFYDGPSPGDSFSMFDGLLATLDTVIVQSFSSFVAGQDYEVLTFIRGTSHTVSVSDFTPAVLDAVKTEMEGIAKQQLAHGGSLSTVDVDPFLQYGQYATDSAYPHADSPLPISLYLTWQSASEDAFWYNATTSAIARIKQVAVQDGVFKDTFTAYPNYAMAGTTPEELYGTANTRRLKAIKSSVDPGEVMGLAGGFDITGNAIDRK